MVSAASLLFVLGWAVHPLVAPAASTAAADLLGLPVFPGAPSNPELIALGQRLFFDAKLSSDGAHSCASCHAPEQFFSDGLRVSKGVNERLGTRNAPSLLNVAYNTSQFWEGRDATLEIQAPRPLTNPREMGLPDDASVLKIVGQDPQYVEAFARVFGAAGEPSVSIAHLAQALAAYQTTLRAGDSAFDRYAFRHEKGALSASAERGLRLFTGTARCTTCHTIERDHALFTDNEFHALSVGMERIGGHLGQLTTQLAGQKLQGLSLDQIILSNDDFAELGRFAVTLDPKDIGKFRTPSLRNVAVTAPYMHDGSVPTLMQAVEYEVYYRSIEQGRPLLLTPMERQDLVAFLESLTTSREALARLTPAPQPAPQPAHR
ncbi:cytochrome-c peroxidase [Cupriavidus pauculus]|uniref:cytochrome-c peroxidase n=1 Tax=Cupriavidus pauculus TaxID=82633 RepID=UPI001EE377E5|nr:cytochrome c peroxidase [Cupriavidus pauculus]GJG96676.1 cytochrome-c peroxidase [Cupriavidus pauculus]